MRSRRFRATRDEARLGAFLARPSHPEGTLSFGELRGFGGPPGCECVYRDRTRGTTLLGRTHVYRFHIADPIYFDRSLRFTIEHGHNDNLTLDMATVAYWYQTEPHKPFPALPSREARAPIPMIGPVEIHRWRREWRKAMGNDSRLWGNETNAGGGG